jgi:hypothetical protein
MLDDRRAAERGFRLHEHCRDDLPSAIGACPRPNPAFGFDLGLASAPENPPATLISADPEGGAQDVHRFLRGRMPLGKTPASTTGLVSPVRGARFLWFVSLTLKSKK